MRSAAPALYLVSTAFADAAAMRTGALRHVVRPRPVLFFACIATATLFVCDVGLPITVAGSSTTQSEEMPTLGKGGTRERTADAAYSVSGKPSRAAVTAFYRRVKMRTTRLMGEPPPKWKMCPRCRLAFRGRDTVLE